MRRYGIVLGLVAVTAMAGGGPRLDAATGPRLRAISTTSGARPAVLIEASEPVAYVSTRPDPFTVLVDLRNVAASGYANGFVPEAGSPVRSISVEPARGDDGAEVARVRVSLSEPVGHEIRSQRNLIFVELERDTTPSAVTTSVPSPAPVAQATTDAGKALAHNLRAVRTEYTATGASVVLVGDGRLVARNLESAGSRRVYLDFPGVSPNVAPVTQVGKGGIERIRVGLNSREPLVTRVVIDLNRDAAHALSTTPGDWRELRVNFSGAQGSEGSKRAAPVAPAVPSAPSAPASDAPAAAASVAPASAAVAALVDKPAAAVAPAAPVAAAALMAPAVPAQAASVAPNAAVSQAPVTLAASVSGAKQYTGHPISLDFQGADLRAVLRTFAEISGLNIVIDPAVQGSVDVSLRDVPWDQALDIILRANKLGYSVDGTIVRVAPLNVLADEEKQRRTLADAQALSGELHVMTMTLSYATADQLKGLLLKSALSQRGTVEVDQRSNTLIITDLQASLDKAASLISSLDRPQPQVEIEARIVITNKSFRREVGAKLGLGGEMSARLGNPTNLAFPNNMKLGGTTGAATNNPGAPNAVNLGVPAATSALGLALGAVNGAFNLDLAISALEQQGKLTVISTPRVSTQNNVEAEITQGTQIPIQVVANNTVTVQFKDAALKLTVTPQITAANTVIMKIQLENAQADFGRSVNGIPPIDTQRANTTVLIGDGQTTVIGGIYFSSQQSNQNRTPVLHNIPLLGWLFKDDLTNNQNNELLIFITPRILKS
jgi:type IV pilus assembly protein PilQ